MLESIRRDASYAARALGRSPIFTMVAVASVAIGIGATTSIVTLANSLLFKPAPGIGNPERVVNVGSTRRGEGFDNFSWPTFLDYREAKSLSGLASVRVDPLPASLAGPSGGEAVNAGVVSYNFFEVLQARPTTGRFFAADEDKTPGANPVVVLSHKYWTQRFGADRSIVGKTVTLNANPFTVIGIAEEGFQGPFVIAPDLWVTVMGSSLVGFGPGSSSNRAAVWTMAVGRLAPTATLASAQAELSGIALRNEKLFSDTARHEGVKIESASLFPGQTRLVVGGFLGLLFALGGLVLIVASTNVAGMLLARATVRQREIAVRLALGASRAQVVGQLVIESLMLSIAAGIGGVILAKWLVNGLMALVPKLPVPLVVNPEIDWRVLVVAFGVSLLTGLLTGVIPALQTTHPDLVPALKSEGGSGRRHRARNALLVAQIAFSMLLLIVGGLFGRALVKAKNIDPGFEVRGLHLASMDLRLVNYDSLRGRQFAGALLERAAALPGVESATLTAVLPLDGGGMGLGGVEVADRPAPQGGWNPDWNVVTPGYFATMRIPLARGRDFTDADRAGAPMVAILNETFANTLWPGQDPLGKTFKNGNTVVTVVGVARDSKYRTLGVPVRPNFLYVPYAQNYLTRMTLLVRAPGASPLNSMRRLVAAMEPGLPIQRLQSFESHAETSLFPQRVAVYVAGSLGTVALLLALLGIYGVTAFSVAQRTREIGVRVALGADRGNVVGMVLRQGLVLAGIGVVIGAVAGAAVTKLLSSLLYGIGATDAVAFIGAGTALGVAALVASWIPATRAAAVDPVIALRSD